MGALAYLEFRAALHHAVAIARSPLRLGIWIPYVLAIAVIAYERASGPRHGALLDLGLPNDMLTAIGGVYLGTLGVTIAFAASGRVSAFRSAAEAILFVNAGVRPLAIAVWLQLRKIVASWSRWISALTYIFLLSLPPHGPLAIARVFVAALLALAVHMCTELPAFLLARGRLRAPVRTAGWALAAVGFGCALGAVFGRHLPALPFAARLDPGRAVRAIAAGNGTTIAFLLILLATLAMAVVLLGDDAIPELYAASMQTNVRHSLRRADPARTAFVAPAPGHARGARVPGGALALAWKDWIAFRRGRTIFGLWLAGCVFWSLCGIAVAVAANVWDDRTPLVTLTVFSALFVVVGATFGAAHDLGRELSKPIFWLSQASLRSRLAAWTFGRALRGGVAIALGPCAAAIVSGQFWAAAATPPLALGCYWSLQCLGVGLFAMFPDAIDARGPLLLLRVLMTGLYLGPPLLIATLAEEWGRGGPILAFAALTAILVAEGLLALQVAVLRIHEHGAAIGRAAAAR
jgi:hypothetical protein